MPPRRTDSICRLRRNFGNKCARHMHKLITNSCFTPWPSWRNRNLVAYFTDWKWKFQTHNANRRENKCTITKQQIGDSLKAKWYFSAFGECEFSGFRTTCRCEWKGTLCFHKLTTMLPIFIRKLVEIVRKSLIKIFLWFLK